MSQESVELYNQGYWYYTGTNGFPLNYNKALDFFKKAAVLGNTDAMNYLGVMYQYGKNVIKNTSIAADWYYKAIQADNGNAYAAHNLGGLYYHGDGVPKDMVKAFHFYKAAVDLGLGNITSVYPQSCYMTGVIAMQYYKNNKAAVPYFVDAAKYGNIPEAWHNLGWLCEQGAMNVEKDKVAATALGFYENAAELGLAQSMDAVGRIYFSVGMTNEARDWLSRAVAKGYGPAKKRLKLINASQSGSIFDLFK